MFCPLEEQWTGQAENLEHQAQANQPNTEDAWKKMVDVVHAKGSIFFLPIMAWSGASVSLLPSRLRRALARSGARLHVLLPFPLPKRSLSYDHKGTIASPMNSRC